MAFVIVSAGHLTNSRLRTLPARPLLVAAGLTVLLLMAFSVAAGYRLAQRLAPGAPQDAAEVAQPEFEVLARRVGLLAGRLAQLEQAAATLALRVGVTPVTGGVSQPSLIESSGGPLLPVTQLAWLETELTRLDGTLVNLSTVTLDHELESMAYPNRMPVAGSRVPVSSPFGTRHDPFTGRLARHTGLDIPARHGTPILASGGGRVVTARRQGAYGLAVVIDHGDGLSTLYGHASRLLVREGDIVLPNQAIAQVGSSGRSTGPHLHFEVIRDGQRVEPRQFLARVLGGAPGTRGP